LLVALIALAAAAENGRVVMGRAPQCVFTGGCPQHDWLRLQQVVAPVEVPLVFSIQPKETLDTCSQLLTEVSTPSSANYGKHLSFEEIGSIFGNKESADAVKDWLLASGIPASRIEVTPNFEFITVRVPHTRAESLLATKFHTYTSKTVNKKIARAAEYSLPSNIASHVVFVGNAVSFPATLKRPLVSTFASGNTDPALLNSFYGIDNNNVDNAGATQSLFESLGQSYSEVDLSLFETKFGITRNKVVKVIGPNDPNACKTDPNNCAEADLDVQYIKAVARNSPTTYWSVPGDVEPFVEWIKAVAATQTPPLVHSISYGSVEQQNDQSEMKSFNLEACKAGLRGLTVVVSSGDDGVANFVARQDASQCGFNPSYPASCPFVTAVGATQGPEEGKPEVACSSDTNGVITTGGGFSVTFPTPAYQADAVANFFKVANKTLPPANQYNGKGRGYPDVSIMGRNYLVNIGGQFYPVSGTSASAPVFAGMLTLVNNARLKAGKKPVGFANPALYQLYKANPAIFKDTTKGNNKCCAGDPGQQVCCKYGFTCSAGWDPVTGLGSVNFKQLRDAWVALP